jgi:hypothetical protein
MHSLHLALNLALIALQLSCASTQPVSSRRAPRDSNPATPAHEVGRGPIVVSSGICRGPLIVQQAIQSARVLVMTDGTIWKVQSIDAHKMYNWYAGTQAIAYGNHLISVDNDSIIQFEPISALDLKRVDASEDATLFLIGDFIYESTRRCSGVKNGDVVYFTDGARHSCTGVRQEIVDLDSGEDCAIRCVRDAR